MGNWDELHDEVCQFIENTGPDQLEFKVATCNLSEGDGQMAVVIWWDKAHKEALHFEVGGRGECCNIF